MSEKRPTGDRHERGRLLLDSLPILVTTHADDGRGTYTGVYTGLQVKHFSSHKELIGTSLDDVLNPAATEILRSAFEEALETGARQYVEFPVVFGSEEFWRGAFVAPLDDSTEDSPDEVVVAGFDLTRHRDRESLLYDVLDAMETNASRHDLERAFCERLVEQQRYEMAWIGTDDGDELSVRATANADEYLTELRAKAGHLEATADPGVRALRSKEPITVCPIEPTGSDWTTVARNHGLLAAIALPLTHQGVEHGVLAVYFSDAEHLVPWREEILVDYADAIGYALSATLWRWALSTDAAATLDAWIPQETTLTALCARSGIDKLHVTSVVPRAGETLYYLDPVETGDVAAAATDVDGIRPLVNGPEPARAVVVESETPERRLLQFGGQFHAFRVEPTGMKIAASIPRTGDIREVSTCIREGYPDARISIQWGQPDDGFPDAFDVNVNALLTDRQYEVLQAAYHNGYFRADREHNATEIAEMLGISRWTFSEHLRRAQGKLFSHLLDDPQERRER